MIKSIPEQQFTFAYLLLLNKEHSPGVYKKVLGTVKGAEKNGYKTRIYCDPPKPGFLKRMSDMIIQSEEKVLMIRSLCEYNFYIIYALIVARFQGKKIIMDVPTPNKVAVMEIYNGDKSILGKFKSLLYLIISGPVPYWFVHRVIQYAQEGEWFLLGNKNKTRIIGNGIDMDSFHPRNKFPLWPSKNLRLLVVASLNYWHGVDRLIKAIYAFNKDQNNSFKVNLDIVGEGSVCGKLKDLVKELDLKDDITFKGFLTDDGSLYNCYENCHAGVGSLGLFRKKLNEASELKAREYTAVGIPFIASGDDPDFPENAIFRYRVSNSEEIESIIGFFKNFDTFYNQISINEIRNFAKENLDYSIKFQKITVEL